MLHELELTPVLPDLSVPRAYPCTASGFSASSDICGVTPASRWVRYCINGHEREVRLCGTHAALVSYGQVACRECTDHGTISVALIRPKEVLLLSYTEE